MCFVRLILVVELSVFLARTSTAQCNVSSVVSIGTVNCSGFDVVVSFFGTPTMTNYAFAISTDDGSVYQSGGTNSSGYTYRVPWTTDAVVTSVYVTAFDPPSGCQSVGAWTGTLSRPAMDLQYTLTLDCNTGLRTLRWTNANTACGNAGVHTYTVDASTGTVASAFTQESTSVWRYNTQLASGTHTFGIDVVTGNYTGYDCSGTLQCWALSTNGLITLNAPVVTVGDCGSNFYLQMALDGAYTSGTLMSDALRAANLVPTTQPYTGLGYSYVGAPTGLTMPAAMLTTTGGNAIVDWVVVEVRNALSPATVVYSKPALLQRDGDVVDVDGSSYVNVPITAGNYHVAVRHRNHLGIMTGSARALTVDPANNTIDFRSAGTTTYGSNARVLKGSYYCLWSGDVVNEGIVRYVGASNDRDPILTAVGGATPTATLTGQYRLEDVNMDGVIKYVGAGNDRDPILTTVGGTVPTATRSQQLP